MDAAAARSRDPSREYPAMRDAMRGIFALPRFIGRLATKPQKSWRKSTRPTKSWTGSESRSTATRATSQSQAPSAPTA